MNNCFFGFAIAIFLNLSKNVCTVNMKSDINARPQPNASVSIVGLNLSSSGNFCCNDGICFNYEYVCDGLPQCGNAEDEANCESYLIKIPEYYDKRDPPTAVNVNISIMDIMRMNDHDSSFDVYFSVGVEWFDIKLKFQYLKNNYEANTVSEVDKSKIWIPNIEFAIIREAFKSYDPKLYVLKNAQTNRDELSIKKQIYAGSENPLLHLNEHILRFFCNFDGIAHYPMETETCSFYFYLDGPANRLTKITSNLRVPSKKNIDRFEITDWTRTPDHSFPNSEKKMVKISVTVSKKPFGIYMITYVPTILMNIINQATNFLTGDTKYDIIITVNITSMMVLASIYLSVSTSKPSTPTIKPVEMWLFFSLAYPFLVIITNLVMQVSRYVLRDT